jgi:FAD/FMN-containing dehydrogenase
MSFPPPVDGDFAVTAADARSLSADVDGVVLVPGDDAYAGECATYNLAVARRPAVVVGATSRGDVSSAVRFGMKRGLPVGVLATGHGTSVPGDGAVLVTTRRMNAVSIDPVARTARAEAGARWQQVIEAAAPHGLAPLSGSSPQVGVVGYTLGGGLSPIAGRAHGWAADHVRAIEMIAGDGQLIQTTAQRDADLFWAVRGGKDNFGIVTMMEFDLVEVPHLYGGGLYFRGELAADVLHAYQELAPALPEEMTVSVALMRLPALDIVPEPLRGKLAVHVRVAYLGAAGEAEQLLAPIRRVGPALIDTVGDLPYEQAGTIHADPPIPIPVHEGSRRLTELPAAAVAAIVAAAGPQSDCPLTMLEVRQLGGALSRDPEVPNAVSGRSAAFQVFCAGIAGPDGAQDMHDSTDKVFSGLRAWEVKAGTLNYLGSRDTAPETIAETFGEQTYDRLSQVKRSYDPDNLFRVNHNILPAAQAGRRRAAPGASSSAGIHAPGVYRREDASLLGFPDFQGS